MKFILEFQNYYQVNDIVLIEYWYNGMITPVKIIDKRGNKFQISHNISESNIRNAPDELIKLLDIIDKKR